MQTLKDKIQARRQKISSIIPSKKGAKYEKEPYATVCRPLHALQFESLPKRNGAKWPRGDSWMVNKEGLLLLLPDRLRSSTSFTSFPLFGTNGFYFIHFRLIHFHCLLLLHYFFLLFRRRINRCLSAKNNSELALKDPSMGPPAFLLRSLKWGFKNGPFVCNSISDFKICFPNFFSFVLPLDAGKLEESFFLSLAGTARFFIERDFQFVFLIVRCSGYKSNKRKLAEGRKKGKKVGWAVGDFHSLLSEL